MTDNKSYVYENVEVVKTGKLASKKLRSGKEDILCEVTPKDNSIGTWKKWVRPDDLFEVQP